MVKNIFLKLQKAYKVVFNKDTTTLAAAVTYYLIIAIVPFVVLLFGMAAFFGYNVVIELNLYESFIPGQLIEILAEYNNVFRITNFIEVVFLLIVIYLASGFFGHLLNIGKLIYKNNLSGQTLKYKRFLQRPISILLLLGIIATLVANFIITDIVRDVIGANADISPGTFSFFLVKVIGFTVGGILTVCYLILINVIISPRNMKVRDNYLGSMLTYSLWIMLSFGLFELVDLGLIPKRFGLLSTYLTSILWIYILALSFIYGVKYNKRVFIDKNHDRTLTHDVTEIDKYFQQNIQ